MVTHTEEKENIDVEWLQLVLMARQLGLSIEDVRGFITTGGNESQAAATLDDSSLTERITVR